MIAKQKIRSSGQIYCERWHDDSRVPDVRDEINGNGLIDKVYDGLDSFVTGVGHLVGVDVNRPDPDATQAAGAPSPVVPPDRQIATPSSSAAPAQRALPSAAKVADRPFEIVEVVGRGGEVIAWIVTNGHEKAECGSMAIARSVLEYCNQAIASKAP